MMRSRQPHDSTLACAVALSDHYSRKLGLGERRRQPTPTLAQQLGLVPKPDQLCTPEQWEEIHGAAQRQGALSTGCCAICLEGSAAEQQVLLSCSHVFHRTCLAAFERHIAQQAAELVCPLCRKPSYQKKMMPDSRAGLIRECSALGRSLAALVQQSADNVDSLEAELDASLARCRQLTDGVQQECGRTLPLTTRAAVARSTQHQQPLQPSRQHSSGRPQPSPSSGDNNSTTQRSGGRSSGARRRHDRRDLERAAAAATKTDRHQQHSHSRIAPATPASVDWEAVVAEAGARGETECTICLAALTARREVAGVALLSCTHVFHAQCVLSFERFEAARGGEPSCPVCRAAYSRRCFAAPDTQ